MRISQSSSFGGYQLPGHTMMQARMQSLQQTPPQLPRGKSISHSSQQPVLKQGNSMPPCYMPPELIYSQEDRNNRLQL